MVDVTSLLKEEDFRDKCTYCGCSIKAEDWETIHYTHANYKVIQCSCGRGNKITLDAANQSHCSWIEQEVLKKHPKKGRTNSSLEPVKHKQHPLLEDKVK